MDNKKERSVQKQKINKPPLPPEKEVLIPSCDRCKKLLTQCSCTYNDLIK